MNSGIQLQCMTSDHLLTCIQNSIICFSAILFFKLNPSHNMQYQLQAHYCPTVRRLQTCACQWHHQQMLCPQPRLNLFSLGFSSHRSPLGHSMSAIQTSVFQPVYVHSCYAARYMQYFAKTPKFTYLIKTHDSNI